MNCPFTATPSGDVTTLPGSAINLQISQEDQGSVLITWEASTGNKC